MGGRMKSSGMSKKPSKNLIGSMGLWTGSWTSCAAAPAVAEARKPGLPVNRSMLLLLVTMVLASGVKVVVKVVVRGVVKVVVKVVVRVVVKVVNGSGDGGWCLVVFVQTQ